MTCLPHKFGSSEIFYRKLTSAALVLLMDRRADQRCDCRSGDFAGWALFIVVWATVVYFPVAHRVFDFGDDGGWIATKLDAIDFAGGTAVHINAGAVGLALAIVLGLLYGGGLALLASKRWLWWCRAFGAFSD